MSEQEQRTVDQQQEDARQEADDRRRSREEQGQAAQEDYESRHETTSALALFQQDAAEQLAGGNRRNRREYYQRLLSRMYTELSDLGVSMLLSQLDDQLTRNPNGSCSMLLYSVVTQCYQMIVLDAPMTDPSNAVPNVFTANQEPMTWEMIASYASDPELPVRTPFKTRVRVLRSVSRLLYEARRDARTVAPEEEVLKRRLDDCRTAMRLQDESLKHAAEQVEEAKRQVERIRSGQAEKELEPIKQQMMSQFEAEMRAQEEQMQQAGRAKFQEAFGEQQKAVRIRMEDEARWASELFEDAGAQYDKIRTEIAKMQEEQNTRMQQWQAALYQADTRMLGQCYVGMAKSLSDALDDAIAKLMTPDMSTEQAKPLLDLRAAVMGQLTRLEYAMKRLGLRVIRPARGDAFQSELHTLTSVSSQTVNVPEFAKIDRCITPGVVAERSDLRFREVIVPAVVTLMVE